MLFDRDKVIVFRHNGKEWIAKFLVKGGRGAVRIVGIERVAPQRQKEARRWFLDNQHLFDLEGLE